MPRVTVTKPFTFTHDDGRQETFVPGSYDLPDEMAEHFYVRAHSQDGENDRQPPQPGTPDYAQSQATEGHMSAIDNEAMRQEIAAAEAEIRKKYANQALQRQRQRQPAFMDDEEGENESDDQEGEDDASRPARRRGRPRKDRSQEQGQKSEQSQTPTQDDEANRAQKVEGPNLGDQPVGQI